MLNNNCVEKKKKLHLILKEPTVYNSNFSNNDLMYVICYYILINNNYHYSVGMNRSFRRLHDYNIYSLSIHCSIRNTHNTIIRRFYVRIN